MLERVYDTLIAILYYELPKDNYGKVVVYDRPITAWYIGERDIKNNNLSVTLKGSSSQIKDIGLGLQEFTHSVSFEINAGADNITITERLVQETNRMILAALRKHRRIWVVEYCPICSKFTLSPEHFIEDHNSILDPYVTGVIADYNALWAETHPTSIPPAELPRSAKATEAFLRLCEDVKNGVTVSGLPTSAVKNIQKMQSEFVEPIRILYDCITNSSTPSDDAIGQSLFRNGTIVLQAKELVKQDSYGPDNVPITAIKK